MRPPCAPARVIDAMIVRDAMAIVRLWPATPHFAPATLFSGCD